MLMGLSITQRHSIYLPSIAPSVHYNTGNWSACHSSSIHQSTTVIIHYGTGHSVKNIMNNVIEATISNQKFKGEEELLLHNIPIIPTDKPIKLKCLQFPE